MQPKMPSKNEVDELSRTILFTVQRLNSLADSVEAHKAEVLRLEAEDKELGAKLDLISSSKEVYKMAVDGVYARSIGRIESTVNDALKFIFHDKSYSAKLQIGDNRGKIIEPLLYDNGYDPPRIVDMKNGVGMGIRSVVSFVLLVFYLIARGRYPVIFADEAYSAISESYIERFFTFAKSLCKARGVTLVMITHDQRFLVYADKRYCVSEGNVSEGNV